MTTEEIMNLINRSLFADLGYVDADGRVSIRRVFCTWHKGLGRHLISTNTSSAHVQALLADGRNVCLYVADSERFEGVCLYGTAAVHFEAEFRELLWHEGDEKYYPGGVTDDDYCVIEFAAQSAYYYRFDGKGELSAAEIARHDEGAQFEDGYARVHGT